jgi:hypothetical protein
MPRKSEGVKQTARSSDTSRLYADAHASRLAKQVATELEGRRRAQHPNQRNSADNRG